jgi:hypothetical protein
VTDATVGPVLLALHHFTTAALVALFLIPAFPYLRKIAIGLAAIMA